MREFSNKVAVVTGAASGIGRALAERAAAEGMRVVLADINVQPLEELAASLQATGTECLARRTDVSRPEDLEALAAATIERFGAVDLLFNNAGVILSGLCWEKTSAEWDWIMGINFHGVANGLRAFVPRMLAQQREVHIVNTASLAGLLSAPFMGPYSVSKFAVRALSETLHYEMQMLGGLIGVSVLCPGQVATNIMDSGFGKPVAATADHAGQKDLEDFLRTGVAAGLAPAQCAEIVFEAIREKRFWIFPHPQFKKSIKTAMECILAESNPRLEDLQIE